MYLPDLWSHLTVNEGETVAYGGQAALSPERRYSLSRQKLDMFPSDFESLKSKIQCSCIVNMIFFLHILLKLTLTSVCFLFG